MVPVEVPWLTLVFLLRWEDLHRRERLELQSSEGNAMVPSDLDLVDLA